MNIINPQSHFKFLITLFLLLMVKISPIFAQYTESTNIANDGIICSGDAITIDSGVVGATAYAWSDGGGVAQTASYNPISNTTYTVTITNGASTTTSEFEVTVDTPTGVSVTFDEDSGDTSDDGEICKEVPDISTGVIAPSGYATYLWSFLNRTTQTYSVFVSGPGVIEEVFTVNVTNDTGCSATAQNTLTIYPLAAPIAASNSPICAGDNLNLMEIGSGGTAWSWSGPNNFTSNLQNPTAPTIAGNYFVTVSNSAGCSETSNIEVTVLPISTSSILPRGSDLVFCSGIRTYLQVIIPNISDTYEWSDGTSGSLFTFANVITVTQTGIYTVTVTNPLGCSATATTEVKEYPIPTATSNSPIFVGGNLNLTEIGGNHTTWQWSGPNSFTSTLQNPTISSATTNVTGTYTVTATNPATGCTGTASTLVAVNPISPGVPTLSQWGLLNLTLLLMICGTLYLVQSIGEGREVEI